MMHYQHDYYDIVEQALRAPSGHNSQPWLVKITPNQIMITADYSRSLTVVDPLHRELFISLGCLAENICIVASTKHYQTQVELNDKGQIMIHLTRSPQLPVDPLANYVIKQQSNRSLYHGGNITRQQRTVLTTMPLYPNIDCHLYPRDTEQFNLIRELILAGNTLQMADKRFITELKQWMRLNKKHAQTTNDGLSYAIFGAPNLPLFMVKPIMACFLKASIQNRQDDQKIKSSSDFMLLTTQQNTKKEWINVGRSWQRLLLACTANQISYAFMNQPIEANKLCIEMQQRLHLTTLPSIVLRLGLANVQPYSRRKPLQACLMSD